MCVFFSSFQEQQTRGTPHTLVLTLGTGGPLRDLVLWAAGWGLSGADCLWHLEIFVTWSSIYFCMVCLWCQIGNTVAMARSVLPSVVPDGGWQDPVEHLTGILIAPPVGGFWCCGWSVTSLLWLWGGVWLWSLSSWTRLELNTALCGFMVVENYD